MMMQVLYFNTDELMIQNQDILVTCDVLEVLALLVEVGILLVFDYENN